MFSENSKNSQKFPALDDSKIVASSGNGKRRLKTEENFQKN